MTPLSNPTSAPRIWHVGDWCAHWGNEFRQSAFRSSIKDFEVLNYARFLIEGLQKIPGTEVEAIPSWELYDRFWAQLFAPAPSTDARRQVSPLAGQST